MIYETQNGVVMIRGHLDLGQWSDYKLPNIKDILEAKKRDRNDPDNYPTICDMAGMLSYITEGV
jgi:hypothetical protein